MKIPILIFLLSVCSIQSSCAFKRFHMTYQGMMRLMDSLRTIRFDGTKNANATDSILGKLLDEQTLQGELTWMLLYDTLFAINEMEQYENPRDIFGMVQKVIAPELQFSISLLDTHFSAVRKQFNLLFEYVEQWNKIPIQTWKTFSETNIGVIEDHLNSLRIAMFPEEIENNGNPGLISTIAHASETLSDTYCIEASMMHYALSHLLQAIRITEMRGAIVLIYASMIQYAKAGEWRTKIDNISANFYKRFWRYFWRVDRAMRIAPKYVRACDPPNGTWIRDTTYFEMEKFEQVTIFQYNIAARTRDCDNAITKSLLIYARRLDRCSGKLSDCKYSSVLVVCRLKNDTKRLEWIKSDATGYGMNFDKCPNGAISEYTGEHYWVKGHCICNCREADKNWISLSPVMTNEDENMVVIGLRFVRKKGVLYIQVKEGKLLANGWIDQSSQRWIPLPEKPELAVINAANNKFYLDDVPVLPNHVIIGIEFEKTDGFAIVQTSVAIDDATGQLMQDDYVKGVANNTHSKYLPLPKRNSIYTHLPHKPDSDRNWITLQVSDWKHDAGQSTVPLFDGVAVETIPPFPVGGVGMFHKGVDNYAGFISLKLFPVQYAYSNLY